MKRLQFYFKKKYAITLIPTIEIIFEKQEEGSYYFDFEISFLKLFTGFFINPKI